MVISPLFVFPIFFPVALGTMEADSAGTKIVVIFRISPLEKLKNWLGFLLLCSFIVSIAVNLWTLSRSSADEVAARVTLHLVFATLSIPIWLILERISWNHIIDHYEGGFEQIFQIRTRRTD